MNKVKKVLVGIFVFVIGTLSKVFADVTYQPDYGVESPSKAEMYLEEFKWILEVLKWIVLPIIFAIGIIVIIRRYIKKGKIDTLIKVLITITIILIIAIIVGFYLL